MIVLRVFTYNKRKNSSSFGIVHNWKEFNNAVCESSSYNKDAQQILQDI